MKRSCPAVTLMTVLAFASCGDDTGDAPASSLETRTTQASPSPDSVAESDPVRGGRMASIPAGTVVIDGEELHVDAFSIDVYEVTNADFAAFVKATGFVTEAERLGNSVVFFHSRGSKGQPPFDVVTGASWRQPKGPGSDLALIGDHPVAHVSWNDATAYADWAGKRLPTRAEWVRAASGGDPEAVYPWGNQLRPGSQHMMNAWQGVFPKSDSALDGYRGSSPVGSFPPNAFGLFDVAGNVWEWTAERQQIGDGPDDEVAEKRGGSFLCRERAGGGFHACRGYRVTSFEWSPISNGNDNVGFRCAK